METLKLVPFIYDNFLLYMLVFTRISTLFSVFILFHRNIISNKITLSLCAVLSFYVILIYPHSILKVELFSLSMLEQILTQCLIGLTGGIILNILFEIFVALGQILSTQIGISVAGMIDPKYGYVTSLTQFYLITISVFFLLLNGHLSIIRIMIDSFNAFPVESSVLPKNILLNVIHYSKVIFNGSIMLSITVILTMLLTNITLGIVTKFAPQLNLFSIGINLALILGLICIYLTFDNFVDGARELVNECISLVHRNLLKLG